MAYSYKGAISFGLVHIPITLTAVIKENDIGFNMLDKDTQSRIQYKKTCVDCGGREVQNTDIVKGYQYEKGKYVLFTEEDFEKLKTEKDKNITISQFTDVKTIDPIYFDRAFYVNPIGGEHAFALLLAAMEKENRAGIAKTVLGSRETLMLIRVSNGIMFANSLFFQDEVTKAPAVEKTEVKKEELALAVNLLANMTKPFEPEQFRDDYHERLKNAIAKKIAGKQITAPNKVPQDNIINIMEALKKSVQMTGEKKEDKPKKKIQTIGKRNANAKSKDKTNAAHRKPAV